MGEKYSANFGGELISASGGKGKRPEETAEKPFDEEDAFNNLDRPFHDQGAKTQKNNPVPLHEMTEQGHVDMSGAIELDDDNDQQKAA